MVAARRTLMWKPEARRRSVVGALLLGTLAVLGCPNGVGVTCPAGQALCGANCVFINVDAQNCGTCGMACPPTLACINGACGCPAGLINCSSTCVNPMSDNLNCGACGGACAAGQVCSAGACALSCGANLLLCSGICADPQVDRANCGGCGQACSADFFCVAGKCVFACPPPHIKCIPDGGASPDGTVCTDPRFDRLNCGGCSIRCPTGAEDPTSCCDGACVDLNTSNSHCGFCGHTCDVANGFQCFGGNCFAT
jgi:hypothetical protein